MNLKDILTEGVYKDYVFLTGNPSSPVLWASYAPGSGVQSHAFSGKMNQFISTGSGENYDNIARDIDKWATKNKSKATWSKDGKHLFKIPLYRGNNARDIKNFDIWENDPVYNHNFTVMGATPQKPEKYFWLLVMTKNTGGETLIHLFKTKNEAMGFAR